MIHHQTRVLPLKYSNIPDVDVAGAEEACDNIA